MPNAKHVAYDVMARGAGYPLAFAFAELGLVHAASCRAFCGARAGVRDAEGAAPEVENTPIGKRVRWRKRTADRVVQDLRSPVGVMPSFGTRIQLHGERT